MPGATGTQAAEWRGVIDRYREFLPVGPATPIVTLLEGNTPLVRAERLAAAVDPRIEVHLKLESLNPTGSFKDRGMTLAVSKAVEAGARAVMCASTGNTSASMAAFAARAGLRAFVLIPEGKVAVGKLSQAMIHGAEVLTVRGSFDDALALVREISGRLPIALMNSVNAYRLEGQKTAAFEVCDRLGHPPDFTFIPVGNAGNITAYWRGYRDYHRAGVTGALPRMIGWQAAGAAPLVHGQIVERPETIASAIRIGNPASWRGAVAAAEESRGEIAAVSDEAILEAYRRLASLEGIFCEPASAASVAGLFHWARTRGFAPGDRVVCVITGHGLKDPETAITISAGPRQVPAELPAVLETLGL
jgi:threonine synthase